MAWGACLTMHKLLLLVCALAASADARVTLSHRISTADGRRVKLAGLAAEVCTKIETLGQKALLTCRLNPLRAEQNQFVLETSEGTVTCDTSSAKLSRVLHSSGSKEQPTRVVAEAIGRFESRQCAYKLQVTARGATVSAATPLVDGGPRSLCCGPPGIYECGYDGAFREWQGVLRWLTKEDKLRLAVARRLGRRAAIDAEVAVDVADGGASAELSCDYAFSPRRRLRAALLRPAGVGLGSARAELEYTDAEVEKGATWVATAAVSPKARVSVTRRCSF